MAFQGFEPLIWDRGTLEDGGCKFKKLQSSFGLSELSLPSSRPTAMTTVMYLQVSPLLNLSGERLSLSFYLHAEKNNLSIFKSFYLLLSQIFPFNSAPVSMASSDSPRASSGPSSLSSLLSADSSSARATGLLPQWHHT